MTTVLHEPEGRGEWIVIENISWSISTKVILPGWDSNSRTLDLHLPVPCELSARYCMAWCGVVWCVMWCDVVWYDVVWCDVMWCDVMWCGVVCRGVVCGVMCCGVMWYYLIKSTYNNIQHLKNEQQPNKQTKHSYRALYKNSKTVLSLNGESQQVYFSCLSQEDTCRNEGSR